MIQFRNKSLTVFESALYKTTSTVIQTEDIILVVDPNWLPKEVEKIRQWVLDQKANRPVYLLFTHSDYDHILGYGAFPEAKVIASKRFSENLKKETIINQILDFDHEYYIERPYKIHYPLVDFLIEADQQILTFGHTKLTFYLAPGHNEDGIFTIIEPTNTLILGDYLSDIEFPYIYHNSVEYEKTIKKVDDILKKHDIQVAIPGHGTVTTSTKEILRRKSDSLVYLNQARQSLEEQTPFDLAQLWQRYHFSRNMSKFHQANLALMQKELMNNQTEK